MKYLAKKSFNTLSYDKNTFEPISINFELREYDINNENDKYIAINRVIFSKIKDQYSSKYFYDYFYTKKEERKLKLKKIQNVNKE